MSEQTLNTNNVIEEKIKSTYGTINNFIDKNYTKLPVSRTHMYQLLQFKIENPGIQTLNALASLLELPTEVVCDAYISGYRNRQHQN